VLDHPFVFRLKLCLTRENTALIEGLDKNQNTLVLAMRKMNNQSSLSLLIKLFNLSLHANKSYLTPEFSDFKLLYEMNTKPVKKLI